MILVCHMIFHNYLIKRSSKFIVVSHLREDRILASLVTVGNVVSDIWL